MLSPSTCPCGGATFATCCAPYLAGQAVPQTAEALMRSRYSAFVFQRANYLLATWHSSTRPAALDFALGAKWLGLDVRSHRVLDADHAEVEFVARLREAGRATRLHERSRFVRESGHWFYVDGDQFLG